MSRPWPEEYEEKIEDHIGIRLPSRAQFDAEVAELEERTQLGLNVPHRSTRSAAKDVGTYRADFHFNARAREDFLRVPSIEQQFLDMVSLLQREQEFYGHDNSWMERRLTTYVGATFHTFMWRHYGRRVYMLDEITYQMLARTELPKLPVSLLYAPLPAFYIQFPPTAFRFCMRAGTDGMGEKDLKPLPANGVSLVFDKPEPGDGESRRISILTVTENVDGVQHISSPTLKVGPDAMIADLKFDEVFQAESYPGIEELSVVLPRVIFGLLLYLASEHPSITKRASKRRDLSHIKNPAKRAHAEKLQQRESKYASYMVSVRSDDRETAEHMAGTGRKLNHQVWVSGHWRQQAYGSGWILRRPLWIKPFLRGPDMAESLKVRLGHVPTTEAK